MVILEGYGVHIVVLAGPQCRMSGCLGNLATVFLPRRWRARRQHVGTCQFVSGAHSEQVLRNYVSLLSDNVNCRNLNIILFVTFLCAVVWIYQCIKMYMRIVL